MALGRRPQRLTMWPPHGAGALPARVMKKASEGPNPKSDMSSLLPLATQSSTAWGTLGGNIQSVSDRRGHTGAISQAGDHTP